MRSRAGACTISQAPLAAAAAAKVTPPTQVELSKPATTTRTRVASNAMLVRAARRDSRQIANRTQEADATCCGTQVAWNSQPANPVASRTIELAPGIRPSSGRSEPVSASRSTSAPPLRRRPSQLVSPIISISAAKAVNQVIAASASQPLTPSSMASSAALKCHR